MERRPSLSIKRRNSLAPRRRPSISATDSIRFQLKLETLPDESSSSSDSSSSSSSVCDNVLLLVAASAFHPSEYTQIFKALLDASKRPTTFICVRAPASVTASRNRRIKNGKSHFLDKLDFPMYEKRDLKTREQVVWWVSKALQVAMSGVPSECRVDLGVTVVAPEWAFPSDICDFATLEDVDKMMVLHTVQDLQEFEVFMRKI